MNPVSNVVTAPGARFLSSCTVKSFHVGLWDVDVAARELSDGTRLRRVSPRAMVVLLMLAEAEGSVVSRFCLMDAVWPNTHVGDESLTQAVAELRRLLGPELDGDKPYILTVQKSGYRLGVPVVWIDPCRLAPHYAGSDIELPLQAHLAVSQARHLRWLHGYTAIGDIKELMDEASAAAPRSACVHAEYAMLVGCTIFHQGDSEARLVAAREAGRRAVELRPDFAKAHCAVGFTSAGEGDMGAVTSAFERAFAIEPYDAEIHCLAAQAFYSLGVLDTALILAERASALDSEDILAPYVAARAASSLAQKERADIAARMCLSRAELRLMLTPGSVRASSVRAAALAMLGRAEEALKETARDGSEPNFRDLVALSEVGDVETALDQLEALVDTGWRARGWPTRDPMFTKLGSSPRYKRLAGHFLAA